MPESPDRVASALNAIPATDRETWYRMASAVKSTLGEAGFTIWDNWSRSSPDQYSESSARATWRGAREVGGPTAGSLFALAREHGWRDDGLALARCWADDCRRASVGDTGYCSEACRKRHARARLAAQARADDKRNKAAERAAEWAELQTRLASGRHPPLQKHPYLEAKGFPDAEGYVTTWRGVDVLVVPMTHYARRELVGAQLIAPDGAKRFLTGMRPKGAVFRIGAPTSLRGREERWYVEGYATGLSVRAALDELSLYAARVVVTFSAYNLAEVAQGDTRNRSRAFVIADHDLYKCSCNASSSACSCAHAWDAAWGAEYCPACGHNSILTPAGERYARKTGLPFYVPPIHGDANDVAQRFGVSHLAAQIRTLKYRPRVRGVL